MMARWPRVRLLFHGDDLWLDFEAHLFRKARSLEILALEMAGGIDPLLVFDTLLG